MLILDEAEHLTAKSLEIVRRLHDMAKIPVVLIGMPALYHTIKSLRKGDEQIANRMISYNLGKPSREDMLEIVKSCFPSAEDGVENALIECSKDTIRTLIILVQALFNFSEKTGKKITVKQVHSLVNSLHKGGGIMTLAQVRELIEFYTLKGNKMNADIYTDILNERLAKGDTDEEPKQGNE